MNANLLYLCGYVALAFPFVVIALVLVHYLLRRAIWKFNKRRGKKNPGFCPSASALGMMLLFMQVFTRPSLQHVLQEKQEEDADEDDEGDPESSENHLHRQLKRIRRGEQVEKLVLRM